jgi:hypothetical protein
MIDVFVPAIAAPLSSWALVPQISGAAGAEVIRESKE